MDDRSKNREHGAGISADLGKMPVHLRDDGQILVEIGGVTLAEGAYQIGYPTAPTLPINDRRPLAALLETRAGEARFELGTAQLTETGIELTLFGPLELPVRYLTF